MTTTVTEHVRIRHVETLADAWYSLRKYCFDYKRRDGTWQQLTREVCTRGNSAVVLLYCPKRRVVILTRQFRLPVFVHEHSSGMLLELPSGLVDDNPPEEAVRREAEEETGFLVSKLQQVLTAYMSPALLMERLHFFVAEVDMDRRSSSGGGSFQEGEDIEVVPMPFEEALAMIDQGSIVDGKTIMLLYYAKLKGLI